MLRISRARPPVVRERRELGAACRQSLLQQIENPIRPKNKHNPAYYVGAWTARGRQSLIRWGSSTPRIVPIYPRRGVEGMMTHDDQAGTSKESNAYRTTSLGRVGATHTMWKHPGSHCSHNTKRAVILSTSISMWPPSSLWCGDKLRHPKKHECSQE